MGTPAGEPAAPHGSGEAPARRSPAAGASGQTLPKDLASHYDEALASLRQGHKTRAFKMLRKIASAAPHHIGVHFLLGLAMRGRGLRDRAREGFEALEHEHPDSPLGPTGLALLALDDGRTEEARRHLARARATGQDSPWLSLAEGKTLQMEGQDDAALERFRRACGEDPTIAEAWARQGIVLSAQGRYDEAETALRRGLEAKPNDLAALHQLALALEHLGRKDEARAVREAHNRLGLIADLGLSPPGTSERARRRLAAHFERSGELREALAEYDGLLAMKPDDEAVKARAAEIRRILQNRRRH